MERENLTKIKALIQTNEEANIFLAIHLCHNCGISIEYLADCIYLYGSRQMINCHGDNSVNSYDAKFYFSFSDKQYSLSVHVESIKADIDMEADGDTLQESSFRDDFDRLLRIGGTKNSIQTKGLIPSIDITNSKKTPSPEEIKQLISRLLKQYINDLYQLKLNFDTDASANRKNDFLYWHNQSF